MSCPDCGHLKAYHNEYGCYVKVGSPSCDDQYCWCRLRYARPEKIQIIVDDETRPILETARRAKREVESWPAWKRGETDPEEMAWREVWAEELKSRTPRRW